MSIRLKLCQVSFVECHFNISQVRRILVADPAERLSMEEIKAHTWFLRGLPRGALDMNDFYLQAPPFLEQVCSRPSPCAARCSSVACPCLLAGSVPKSSQARIRRSFLYYLILSSLVEGFHACPAV